MSSAPSSLTWGPGLPGVDGDLLAPSVAPGCRGTRPAAAGSSREGALGSWCLHPAGLRPSQRTRPLLSTGGPGRKGTDTPRTRQGLSASQGHEAGAQRRSCLEGGEAAPSSSPPDPSASHNPSLPLRSSRVLSTQQAACTEQAAAEADPVCDCARSHSRNGVELVCVHAQCVVLHLSWAAPTITLSCTALGRAAPSRVK